MISLLKLTVLYMNDYLLVFLIKQPLSTYAQTFYDPKTRFYGESFLYNQDYLEEDLVLMVSLL